MSQQCAEFARETANSHQLFEILLFCAGHQVRLGDEWALVKRTKAAFFCIARS